MQNPRRIVKIFLLLLFITVAIIATSAVKDSEILRLLVEKFGYIGIFLLAIISGINLVVPIPIIFFVPLFVASGLNFWITVMIISVGLTIGDLVGYFFGIIGRDISKEKYQHFIARLEAIRQKYPTSPLVLLFFFAIFAPLPNELLVAPLAFMGYTLRRMVPALFLGNILFNILFGYLGISLVNFI